MVSSGIDSEHIIMPCRPVTAGELGVKPGWGAGQSMWYMEELNQFVAPMLLPSQPIAAIATNRHLQHDKGSTAGVLPIKATQSLQQQAQQEDLIVGPPLLERQGQRAALQVEKQPQRTVLQDATDSKTQEPVKDQAAAVPVMPLADEVGEVYMYTADDIRAIAPLWWNYTIQMRVFHETHEQVRWQTPVASEHCPFYLWPMLFLKTHTCQATANRCKYCIKMCTSKMACHTVHNNHTLPKACWIHGLRLILSAGNEQPYKL